jgi:hypothetical protein
MSPITSGQPLPQSGALFSDVGVEEHRLCRAFAGALRASAGSGV